MLILGNKNKNLVWKKPSSAFVIEEHINKFRNDEPILKPNSDFTSQEQLNKLLSSNDVNGGIEIAGDRATQILLKSPPSPLMKWEAEAAFGADSCVPAPNYEYMAVELGHDLGIEGWWVDFRVMVSRAMEVFASEGWQPLSSHAELVEQVVAHWDELRVEPSDYDEWENNLIAYSLDSPGSSHPGPFSSIACIHSCAPPVQLPGLFGGLCANLVNDRPWFVDCLEGSGAAVLLRRRHRAGCGA
jgi:hypothetical protein